MTTQEQHVTGNPLPQGGGYIIHDSLAELDLDAIHAALVAHAPWARDRPREVTERAFAASRVVGARDLDGATIGFGRAVTDGATFAWLCDVVVVPAYRGRGIATSMVTRLLGMPDLQRLDRWMLDTVDAHEIYEPLGFARPETPGRLLVRLSQNLTG